MKDTNTQRVYNYIKWLCETCHVYDNNNNLITPVPVMVTKQNIANKLKISTRTVVRAIDELIKNNNIYRLESNNGYIYSLNPIDAHVSDIFIRFRL